MNVDNAQKDLHSKTSPLTLSRIFGVLDLFFGLGAIALGTWMLLVTMAFDGSLWEFETVVIGWLPIVTGVLSICLGIREVIMCIQSWIDLIGHSVVLILVAIFCFVWLSELTWEGLAFVAPPAIFVIGMLTFRLRSMFQLQRDACE